MIVSHRIHEPGAATFAAHLLVLALVWTVLAPLMLLRLVLATAAELVIRATDRLQDVLAERLEL